MQQQQIQQQQMQQQKQQQLQRIAPKTMEQLQQQGFQQGYPHPQFNNLPPPPPLGHMGHMGRPFPHGRPPGPQGFLPHHFQGHPPRHQNLIEANNAGSSAQPQPHQGGHHSARSNFNQQQIHKHQQVIELFNFRRRL